MIRFYLFALVVLAGVYAFWRHEERLIGARDARIAALDTLVTKLDSAITADSLRLAKRDTVTLFKRIATTDTLLRQIIDTAIVHHRDTVTIERRVLVTADSELRACRETITDCARLANDRGAQLEALNKELALVKQQRPSFLARCGLSVGYGATARQGVVYAGPSVLAGCRVIP